MKTAKKILCAVLTICMTAGLFFVPSADIKAAAAPSATSKVHMYAIGASDQAIRVNFKSPGDKIKNLKTNNKNLTAVVTRTNSSSSSSSDTNPGYASIGLRSKKAGTYKVTFDLYSKENKKIKSFTTTVYANNDSAVKKATFAGEQYFSGKITTKKSGKFSIKLNKGYSLQSITVETYDKDGKTVSKTVKNNKKITLGVNPYKYEYSYEDGEYFNYNLNTRIYAETRIIVTYKDKYTKESATTSYYIYSLAD